ncbi:MAG TPA: nickel-binding protein [Longimicrobiales bacterium]
MVDVIVETRFEEPLTAAAHGKRQRLLGPCVMRNDVRWVQSYLSNDRRRMICHFQAADAEAVRMAHRTAGVVFERVWTAAILAPPQEEPAGD